MAATLLAAILSTCWPAAVGQPVLLPWHDPAADLRQTFSVIVPTPRQCVRLDLNLSMIGDRPVRIVAADHPNTPLPIFRDRANHAWLVLPGPLDPQTPRLLLVYASSSPNFHPSPALPHKPPPCDYAVTAHGDAWDFDEGDQDGINQWGNRPTEYGNVQVRDGKLIIPVTGKDPYFIWGVMFGKPDPRRVEHIDSRTWRYLRMRIKQTARVAQWSVYVTDAAGQYRPYHFIVRGKEWQTIEIDLSKAFSDFWDGREFRALRIDPTNNSPGTLVQIDWIRLEAPPPQVVPGPVLTRTQVTARTRVAAIRAVAPAQAHAGERAPVHAMALDKRGAPVPYAPLCVGIEQSGGLVATFPFATDASGRATIQVPVGTKAAHRRWLVGLCDDLGHPSAHLWRAPLTVAPGPIAAYHLIPQRQWVPTNQPRVKLRIWAVDRFGNRCPVDISNPSWHITGGATIDARPLRGQPAEVIVHCSRRPLTKHVITLTDEKRRSGTTELMTVAYKKSPVKLGPNGYFVHPDGHLFLPLGGFYANWPAAQPQRDGRLPRALDLFPCGPSPYPHGFPWPPQVEKQVADFLRLCHSHGVTALRLMLRNMDLVGRVDMEQLRAVLHYFDLARPLGIRFDVVLFEDYDKPPYCNERVLEKIVLPQYTADQLRGLPPHRARFLIHRRLLKTAAEKYTDPDVIACQKDYLAQLLPHLVGRDEIFCYELENEMVHPPMSWVNEITAFIRQIDPHTPIVGNPGPHHWPEPLRWRSASVDLYSYHPYNDGLKTADHGAVLFMIAKWSAAAGKPMFPGEGGINQSRWQKGTKKVPPAFAARGIRDQIWLSLCSGACGAFMWAPEHEREMAEFAKVLPALQAVGIDLTKMDRQRPQLAIRMPGGPAANTQAFKLSWRLLTLGADFDVLGPDDSSDSYTQIIQPDSSDTPLKDDLRLFAPAEGYQLAYLASQDFSQVLIYLRNVAGGVVNMGDGRPCFLRKPSPATAAIKVPRTLTWNNTRAYDLDADQPARLAVAADGRISIAAGTTHDYVIGLRR